MSTPAITVENLGKTYMLRHRQAAGYTALRDVLAHKAKNIFSKTKKSSRESFDALDDVSFTVGSGERIGIIGRNGAGKSTLLKILSRIVAPTRGQVTIEGRVASLLEVGTGFHPELSGRENIFLNGSILGMTKREITSKFDEIVAFAEIEKFLDTPVKRYSSGMYVRLAFAVAAHLNPEILIVDEVLAVGDAEFQRKCLGKMKEVSTGGRTVLFVSHNMQAVQKLCNTGLLLHKGKVVANGEISRVVSAYLDSPGNALSEFDIPMPIDAESLPGFARVVQIENEYGQPVPEIPVGRNWRVRVKFRLNKSVDEFIIALGIVSSSEVALQTTWSKPQSLSKGEYEAVFSNEGILLTTGQYRLVVGLSRNDRAFHYSDNAAWLSISDAGNLGINSTVINTQSGLVLNQMQTSIQRIK